MKPTSMFYRNLLAIEAEEAIRCHPLDGVGSWAAATRPCRRC